MFKIVDYWFKILEIHTFIKVLSLKFVLFIYNQTTKFEIAIKSAGMSYEILMERSKGNEDVFEFKLKFEINFRRNFGRDDSQLIEKHLGNLIDLSGMEANASQMVLGHACRANVHN